MCSAVCGAGLLLAADGLSVTKKGGGRMTKEELEDTLAMLDLVSSVFAIQLLLMNRLGNDSTEAEFLITGGNRQERMEDRLARLEERLSKIEKRLGI